VVSIDVSHSGFPEESSACSQSFGSPLQGEQFFALGSEGVALGYDGFRLSGEPNSAFTFEL